MTPRACSQPAAACVLPLPQSLTRPPARAPAPTCVGPFLRSYSGISDHLDERHRVDEQLDDDDDPAEQVRLARTLQAMVRWRYVLGDDGKPVVGEDGRPKVESNARFVEWEDGSLQLMIGDEFVLDVQRREAPPGEFV